MQTDTEHSSMPPVLVIGGGPVGLALAGDLGWRGIPVILFEQTDGEIYQPKMDGVNVRTMEFCRRWGIADKVHNCSYPKNYPQDMVYLTSFTGYELGREAFATPSGGGEENTLGSSPEIRARCPQNLFDPILRAFSGSQASVELRYRTRAVALQQDADGVVLKVEDLETGVVSEVQGSFVVGCDGGGSWLRQDLGIEMIGDGTLTYATNVIFRCKNLQGQHNKLLGYRHIFIGPEGTWGTCVAINGTDQWRLSLVGNHTKRKLEEHEIKAAILRSLGQKLDFEIISIVPWVRRELVAKHYRSGRAFLAGDAAHVMSPTGGFGMNTGIGDAVDLSWKLAAELQGWAGPGLLESYEEERKPVGQRAAREATANLGRTLSPAPTPNLLDETLEGAKARYSLGRHFSATMLREWYKLGVDLGYVYRDSSICVPEDSPPPKPELEALPSTVRERHKLRIHEIEGYPLEDPGEMTAEEVMVYEPSAEPGARAPHFYVDAQQSIFDLFGAWYTLVCFADDGRDTETLEQAANAVGLPLKVVKVDSLPGQRLYCRPQVLVRPDGHVCWRGEAPQEAEAMAIVNRVRGAMSAEDAAGSAGAALRAEPSKVSG